MTMGQPHEEFPFLPTARAGITAAATIATMNDPQLRVKSQRQVQASEKIQIFSQCVTDSPFVESGRMRLPSTDGEAASVQEWGHPIISTSLKATRITEYTVLG